MLLAESFLHANPWVPAVVVAVTLFLIKWLIDSILRQRDKDSKHLDYRISSDLAILSNRPDDDDLKVTYLDEEVRNPRIVRIRFTNTGKQLIKGTEFLQPYVVKLTSGRLLDAIITDETADRLVQWFVSDSERPDDQKVTLTIGSLNSGDTFTVQMIVDSESKTGIKVSGRVEGQTRPTRINPTREQVMDMRSGPVGGTVSLILFGVLAIFILTGANDHRTGVIFAVVSLGIGLVIMIWGWRSYFGWRKILYREPD